MKKNIIPSLCFLFLLGLVVSGCAKQEYRNPSYGFASQNQAVFDQQYALCETQAAAEYPAMKEPVKPPYRYTPCYDAAGRTTQPEGCFGERDPAMEQYKMDMKAYEANERQRQEAIESCLNANGWRLEDAPAQ